MQAKPSSSSSDETMSAIASSTSGNPQAERLRLHSQLYDKFTRLITICWDQDPSRRPSFNQIGIELQNIKLFCMDDNALDLDAGEPLGANPSSEQHHNALGNVHTISPSGMEPATLE